MGTPQPHQPECSPGSPMPGWVPRGWGVCGEQTGGQEEGVSVLAGCLWGRGSRRSGVFPAGERLWGRGGTEWRGFFVARCSWAGAGVCCCVLRAQGVCGGAVRVWGEGDKHGARGSRAVSLLEDADGMRDGGVSLWGDACRAGKVQGAGSSAGGCWGAGGDRGEPTTLTHFAGSRPWCRTCHGSTQAAVGRSWPGKRQSPGGHCWPTPSGRCRRCQGG